MSAVDDIEKKYLFRLTRFVALFFIALAIIPIILGIFHYSKQLFPSQIGFSESEIARIIKPVDKAVDSEIESDAQFYSGIGDDVDPLDGLKLPFSVQKNFSAPENMNILKNWLEPMSRQERIQFLNELDTVSHHAESQRQDVADAINKFWEVKRKRIIWREKEKSAEATQNYIYAGIIGGAILMIAVFSLVLVLLAIERNTRK